MIVYIWGFPGDSMVKNLPAMQETQILSQGWEDPLEEGIATHSNIPAWRMPRTEEPGGLQSAEQQRVKHNSVTNTSTLQEFKYNPTEF